VTCDPEGTQRARFQVGLRPLPVRDAALDDGRAHERLPWAQRDVAVAEVEVAREGDLEPFADSERSVRLDVDPDVRGEEREAVRASGAGQRERNERRRRERGA
jgi:hypothetical protein